MTNPSSLHFSCDQLTAMPLGNVNLGVPLVDDAIQIGAYDITAFSRIDVTKDSDGITVVRTDGVPIQVELVEADFTDWTPGAVTVNRHKVFSEPIGLILFRQFPQPGSAVRWYLDGPITLIEQPLGLVMFAQKIGEQALRKSASAP